MTKPQRIFVGRYAMCRGNVEVYLDPSDESSHAYYGWTEDSGYCCVCVIGCKDKEWGQLVRKLMHELVESSTVAEKRHFQPSGILLPVPEDSYLMVMTHPQFTQVIDEAGDALAHALPDMERVWKNWKKEKK